MAAGPGRGALAALGLAGLVWAYKNRDKLSSKLNEYRGQLQEQQGNILDQPSSHVKDIPDNTSRPFDGKYDNQA